MPLEGDVQSFLAPRGGHRWQYLERPTRLVSKTIERIDDGLRKLMDDMIETMHEAPGIGLAAIQIAEPIRLLVVDIASRG